MEINLLKIIKIFNMKYFYFLIMLTNIIYPCAVCYGALDHPVTEGMNNAIMFLLFVISFILLCIGACMYILIKKTKRIEIKRSLHDR